MATIGNLYSAYNGAVSAQRNMFLSSSIAIIMIGFSDKFKHKLKNDFTVHTVRLIGIFIFLISVYIGFVSNYDFRFYLDSVKDELPDNIPIDSWYRLTYVVYLYSLILVLVAFLYLFRKMLN